MASIYPILYSFRRCPYAMRARLALYSAKIAHEHREVDLKNKPQEMLSLSPKGTVPVLSLPEGTILEQSLDIMNWAFNTPALSTIAEQLITENDTTFKAQLDRYKYPGRYDEKPDSDYRKECLSFLNKLEERLHPFLEGAHISMVDMAIFPFIRQFAMVDPEWFAEQPFPSLKSWLNFLGSSALFNDVMHRFSPWKPEDEPIIMEPK